MESFLSFTGSKSGVLVTCDPYSRIIDPTDKATNCVFGDAASATWVRATGSGGCILAADFGTDGSKGHAIRVPGGGASSPLVSVVPMDKPELESCRLHMDGRAVFNFVNSVVPESVGRCLERAQIKAEDVDFFAFHQGSTYMLKAMAGRLGIDPEKLLINMDRYGNTVSSSIPLLLHDLQETGRLRGARVLLSGFGVGLSWATAIVQF